jgi:hypothetical protein
MLTSPIGNRFSVLLHYDQVRSKPTIARSGHAGSIARLLLIAVTPQVAGLAHAPAGRAAYLPPDRNVLAKITYI